MIITQEIRITPEVELVAKALFGHVSCPGIPWDQIPWPPMNKSTLLGYLNKAEAVVKAQREHGVAVTSG